MHLLLKNINFSINTLNQIKMCIKLKYILTLFSDIIAVYTTYFQMYVMLKIKTSIYQIGEFVKQF